MSCAANGLIGTDAALAVLPAGTGDDFAKTIGAGSFDAAVRLLATPKPVRIDAIRVTTDRGGRHFVNVAGAGFDSEVNETANAMTLNLGGTGTYVAALMKTSNANQQTPSKLGKASMVRSISSSYAAHPRPPCSWSAHAAASAAPVSAAATRRDLEGDRSDARPHSARAASSKTRADMLKVHGAVNQNADGSLELLAGPDVFADENLRLTSRCERLRAEELVFDFLMGLRVLATGVRKCTPPPDTELGDSNKYLFRKDS